MNQTSCSCGGSALYHACVRALADAHNATLIRTWEEEDERRDLALRQLTARGSAKLETRA